MWVFVPSSFFFSHICQISIWWLFDVLLQLNFLLVLLTCIVLSPATLLDSIYYKSLHLVFVLRVIRSTWKLFHLILWDIISFCIKSKFCDSWTVNWKKFVIPSVPTFIMDCQNGLLVDTVDDHSNNSDAPDIICISDIKPLTNSSWLNFFVLLPQIIIILLFFPLILNFLIIRFLNELLYNIINRKTA